MFGIQKQQKGMYMHNNTIVYFPLIKHITRWLKCWKFARKLHRIKGNFFDSCECEFKDVFIWNRTEWNEIECVLDQYPESFIIGTNHFGIFRFGGENL